MQGQLFSQHFLRHGIQETPPCCALGEAEVQAARQALQGIFLGLGSDSAINEAQTEQPVVQPVLAVQDDILPLLPLLPLLQPGASGA